MKKTGRQSDRAGFTLIEMLIVITIVGLLSMMAIGSFTHYRKSSLVDLAADNIVSSLYKARDEVRLGKQSGDDVYCRGLKFVAGEEGGVMEVKSKFSVLKTWGDGSWRNGTCSTDFDESPIDLDDLVEVKEVNGGECVFLYSPPDGEVSGILNPCWDVILKYGDSGDGQFERKIHFSSVNGIANITNTGDEEVVDEN